MSEQEPIMRIQFGNGEFEATRDNATLYTFLGKSAIDGFIREHSQYDHLFLDLNEIDEAGRRIGQYIFRTFTPGDVFDSIEENMIAEGFPMALNMRSVPQCDIDAYNHYIDVATDGERADDYIPEDWL